MKLILFPQSHLLQVSILLLMVQSLRANEKEEQNALVVVAGIPINVMRGNQMGSAVAGNCNEVYASNLGEIPLAVQIRLGSRERVQGIPLSKGGTHWYDLLQVNVQENLNLEVKIQVIPGTERITLAERRNKLDFRMSERMPNVLQPEDNVSMLAAIVGADGEPLHPGVYHFTGSFLPGAEGFFGVRVSVQMDFGVTIKGRAPGDENAVLEEQIERFYLWGSTLERRDIAESKQVLENGLALVKKYISAGIADNDGAYNLSPRFQAAALLARLNRKREAITFLQRALSKGAGSANCVWQPYHFGLTADGKHHGKLPFAARDRMYRRLSRLYLEVYGRPLGTAKPQGEE